MPWQRYHPEMPDDPQPARDPHAIDMPFAMSAPDTRVDLHDAQLSAGLVILTSVYEAPDGARQPCLVYRFALPDGSGFYPPVALIMPPVSMIELKKLTGQSVDAAIRAAFE